MCASETEGERRRKRFDVYMHGAAKVDRYETRARTNFLTYEFINKLFAGIL